MVWLSCLWMLNTSNLSSNPLERLVREINMRYIMLCDIYLDV